MKPFPPTIIARPDAELVVTGFEQPEGGKIDGTATE
jgi:hypothetical protein